MINDQYFQLEINIMHDDRVCQLIEEKGMKGFGIYVGLLIELRRRDNYRCSTNSLKNAARSLHVSVETLLQIVHGYSLFVIENENFHSPYLNRVMAALEEKRQRQSLAAKARSANNTRNGSGQFTGFIRIEEKSKEEKSKEEKSRETTATAVEATAPLWKRLIGEAMKEQSWIELQAMNSRLGKDFLIYLKEITLLFEEHIQIQGSENNIYSLRDAKSYFANFIRQGTLTNQRVKEKLQTLKENRQEENPYKYETVDPQTGARSYYGIPIPRDAPPRPSEDAVWEEEAFIWGK